MKKILIAATMLFTVSLMICGVYFPDAPLMWFADASLTIEILRAVLLALLAVLLFSNPPRAMAIRYTIGAVAVLLPIMVIALAMQYKLPILDALVFTEVAIIFGLEALENEQDANPVTSSVKHLSATTS